MTNQTATGARRAPQVSAANQWMACHGSHQAQQMYPGYPGELSQSRLEGRACHEAAQLMFQAWRGTPDGDEMVLFGDIVGRLSKDGIIITQELFDTARVYVTDVIGHCNRHGLIPQLHVEERVSLNHLYANWYCIPDAWVYDAESRVLTLWDFKAGHTQVSAEDNYQLTLGAEGALVELGLTDHERQFVTLDLRIVQPRCFTSSGTIRNWKVGSIQHLNARRRVAQALLSVLDDSPTCTTGPQCRNCSARAHCDALKMQGYEIMDYVHNLQTHTLTGHALGLELRMLRSASDAIKYRLSGLEEQAMHELRAGKPVTWFAAREGKGRETWLKDVPVDQVIAMGDLMGVDLREPVTLKTPAQVRKLGLDDSVIKAYSSIPSTGLKLVEVDGDEARRVFNNNQEK